MSDEYVKAVKAITDPELTVIDLIEIKEQIEARIELKNAEDRVPMYEVIIGDFIFATLRGDELDLALEIFNRKMKEEQAQWGGLISGCINIIKARKSEVDGRRSIW